MDQQLLFEQNPNPMLVYDRETLRILQGNSEFCRQYSYSQETIDCKKVTLEDLHAAEEFTAATKYYINSSSKPSDDSHIWQLQSRKGAVYHVRLSSQPFSYKNYASSLLCITDVTSEVSQLKKFRKAREKLRRSEKLFKKLFTNAPQAIVMVDDKNNVQRINNSFEKLFGYNANELQGRNLNEVITGEDQAQTVADNTLEKEQIYTELKRYSKKGDELHVVVGGIPVYLEGKLIAGFGIYIDVTAQKNIQQKLEESLNEKQVLLEEVHHRVKNNLAIVSGLLQMQTMHVDDERLSRYIQNSQLRIRSMAIVHEMLYESQTLTALNMKNYVQQLADVISGTVSPDDKAIETKVKSDEIELNINQAIPCALAISELITNAYEYAFEGRPAGCVEVQLSGKGEQVAVQVRDNGIGLPDNFDEMRQKSLGLSLIENLCIQLETEIKVDTGAQGTTFNFTFQKAEYSGSSSSNRI